MVWDLVLTTQFVLPYHGKVLAIMFVLPRHGKVLETTFVLLRHRKTTHSSWEPQYNNAQREIRSSMISHQLKKKRCKLLLFFFFEKKGEHVSSKERATETF